MRAPTFRALAFPLAALCCTTIAAACTDATSPSRARRTRAVRAGASAETGAGVALQSQMNPELCASVGGAESGAQIVVARCDGEANQRFTFNTRGEITIADGALCVDASSGLGRDFDAIVLWRCHGGASQQWNLGADGAITGINDKCLDIIGAGSEPGTPLILYTCHGQANQRWIALAKDAPAPPVAAAWTFCTDAGAPCDFIGLRDVRLGGPDGPYVQMTAYGRIPCAAYGFGGVDPAPGRPLHCDYGPLKTTTLVNPMPGMAGLGKTVTVALGARGADGPQIGSQTAQPTSTPGEGSFRTTCHFARFAFDDPLVYPGQPGASHLHAFFGNVGADANSTPESIADRGNSTCRGGTLNRSAYWAPALVDARTGEVQTPADAVFYYKTGYNVDPRVIQPFPAGLRMIAGDKAATSAQDYVAWECRDRWTQNTGAVPTTCQVGDAVRLSIQFPQCWDGVHLDSPDHKSHMAYPLYRNPPQVSTCPASHPVTLPVITQHFDYPVTAASTPAAWRLASDMYASSLPGGFSAHADWMNGWEPATMRTIVTRCLNAAQDCGVGSIGDGRALH